MKENKRKYLIIVEKSYIKKLFEKAFSNIQNQVAYDVDIVVANNHILDTSIEHIKYNLEDIEYKPVILKNKIVPDYFWFIQGEMYQKAGEKILELIKTNSYNKIINACDPDEAGDLIFQYTIESLNLEKYQTSRIACTSLTENTIENAFLSLNI